MPEKATYIHGTDASEQERLVALNRLTNGAFLEFLGIQPDTFAIEVGSGLGILAGGVAEAAPNVRVIGVELSSVQLASARRSRGVRFVQADALALPIGDGTFDTAYARYLLEHVANPGGVLAEMRRVLRPGGRVAVMENDVTLIRFDPPCPRFESVWAAFAKVQDQLGGDPLIGRRLHRLLHEAGFHGIELSVQPEVHWHGSPGWVPWVANIIGNVESARAALIGRGLCSGDEIDSAVDELRSLIGRPDGSSLWIWSRARGIK
jgi:ubiquinone/menaquinone biosynthesis C-methylase UbiE